MTFEILKNDALTMPNLDQVESISKRSETRQRVLLRAKIHAVNRQADVDIRDISRSGFRGSTDIALCVDQMVFISLDELTHCSGTVRWTQDRRFGVKFNQLLDMLPDHQPTDTGDMLDHQARMPRIATQLKAKLSLCDWSSGVKIRNVSKSGMMIETDAPLVTNEQVFINLSNGKILTADVRWVEGDRVGIQLASPVSILQFTYGGLQ